MNPRAPQSLLSLLHTCSQSYQQWMTRGPPERPQERVKLSQSLYPLLKIQTPRHAALPSLIYLKLDLSAQDVHLAPLLASNNQIQAMKHLDCKAANGYVRPPSPLLRWRAFRVAFPASHCLLRVKRVKYTSGACLPLLQECRRDENDRFHTTAAFI